MSFKITRVHASLKDCFRYYVPAMDQNPQRCGIIAERHTISVKMLTYLYEGDFTSEDRWNLLEDYFLGVIPEKVKHDCKKERPDMIFD